MSSCVACGKETVHRYCTGCYPSISKWRKCSSCSLNRTPKKTCYSCYTSSKNHCRTCESTVTDNSEYCNACKEAWTACAFCNSILCPRTYCDNCWQENSRVCQLCSNMAMSELCGQCYSSNRKTCGICKTASIPLEYDSCVDCRRKTDDRPKCLSCSTRINPRYEYCWPCTDAKNKGLGKCYMDGCAHYTKYKYCVDCCARCFF